MQEVYDIMNENSVLILDLREDTGGVEELSNFFDVEIIRHKGVTVTVCCKKLHKLA